MRRSTDGGHSLFSSQQRFDFKIVRRILDEVSRYWWIYYLPDFQARSRGHTYIVGAPTADALWPGTPRAPAVNRSTSKQWRAVKPGWQALVTRSLGSSGPTFGAPRVDKLARRTCSLKRSQTMYGGKTGRRPVSREEVLGNVFLEGHLAAVSTFNSKQLIGRRCIKLALDLRQSLASAAGRGLVPACIRSVLECISVQCVPVSTVLSREPGGFQRTS